MVLSFADRMGTAQLALLESPLDSAGAIATTVYRAGDVGYWEPAQTLIVFLTDTGSAPDGDVFVLGHITQGLEELTNCKRDCQVKLSIDSVSLTP